jgi:tRNA pseudouridine55 synthase
VKPPRLNIDGVLLLNKPTGLTSNAALQKTKRIFNAAKAGHTGTLDPFASGLLPICFGQATKFSGYVLHGDKSYRAVLKLGVTTTTGDIEGQPLEIQPVSVSLQVIRETLPRFLGEIRQTPPMYSALKHQGRPLYEYARAGIEIERTPRSVHIHHLELESFNGSDQLTISVHCSGGTYIRTLAEEIGKALGCGAHLIALERTASGPFNLGQAVSLDELASMDVSARTHRLLAPDVLVAHLPKIDLDKNAAQRLVQGRQVERPEGVTGEGAARAYGPQGFLGVVDLASTLIPRRLMAT